MRVQFDYGTYINQLRAQGRANKNWDKSRLKALLLLLEDTTQPSPMTVLAEIGRIRSLKARYRRSVSHRYGNVLDDLEQYCRGSEPWVSSQTALAANLRVGAEVEFGNLVICMLDQTNRAIEIPHGLMVARTRGEARHSGIPNARLVTEGIGAAGPQWGIVE